MRPIIKTSYTPQGVDIKFIPRDERGRFTSGTFRASLPRSEAKRLFTSLAQGKKTVPQVAGIIKSYSKQSVTQRKAAAMDGLYQMIEIRFHPTARQLNEISRLFNAMSVDEFGAFYEQNANLINEYWGYSEYVKGKGDVEVYSDDKKQELLKQLVRQSRKFVKVNDIEVPKATKGHEYQWKHVTKTTKGKS